MNPDLGLFQSLALVERIYVMAPMIRRDTMGSRTKKEIMRRRAGAVVALPQVMIGGLAVGGVAQRALALGSLAIGSAAIGALAVGALAVGRLSVGKATLKEVTVGRLKVDELVIGDQVVKVDDLSSASVGR
jgi:hypothetical protein